MPVCVGGLCCAGYPSLSTKILYRRVTVRDGRTHGVSAPPLWFCLLQVKAASDARNGDQGMHVKTLLAQALMLAAVIQAVDEIVACISCGPMGA